MARRSLRAGAPDQTGRLLSKFGPFRGKGHWPILLTITVFCLGAAIGVPDSPADPTPPAAESGSATSVNPREATLQANINPNGGETSYTFEFGPTVAYGSSLPLPAQGIGSGLESIPVSTRLKELEGATTYHFRVVATSAAGTAFGADREFTTRAIDVPEFALTAQGSEEAPLGGPSGIASDSSGNAWVVDAADDRVRKFGLQGELITSFGESGAGPGQIGDAKDVATNAAGTTVWVLDGADQRVEAFDSEGHFLRQFGEKCKGLGQIEAPRAITVDPQERIWTVSASCIHKYDSAGNRMLEYGPSIGDGTERKLIEPSGIAVDSKGQMWVADPGSNRVEKFSSSHAYTGGIEEFVGPAGPDHLRRPSGVSVDAEGNLWIADTKSSRLLEFGPSGEFLNEFAVAGSGSGQVRYPADIVASSDHRTIWAADTGNHRIQKWSYGKLPILGPSTAVVTGPSTAAVRASINPQGISTKYGVEYGPTTAYGSTTPSPKADAGSNPYPLLRTVSLSGLEPKANYHYRFIAENSDGTVRGADRVFTTKPKLPALQQFMPPVGLTEATLKGNVNPEGTNTTYQFEYGPTTQYGMVAPIPAVSIGSGTGWIAVSKQITGLTPGTTYHYRITATNAEGTTRGEDLAFKTRGGPPLAITDWVIGVGRYEATVRGRVNPEGVATTYRFEYGQTTAYGQSAPAAPLSAGSGTEWVNVTNYLLQGLEEGSIYHYRIAATNSGGTTYGGDQVLRTASIDLPRYSLSYGSLGSGNGQLNEPAGVAVDPQGNIWVADSRNHRIEQFGPQGNYLRQASVLGEPIGIAIDSSGNIWCTDAAQNKVVKFSSQGVKLAQWGVGGSANGQLNRPTGIAIDREGFIWVGDSENHRIQQFTTNGEFLRKFGEYGGGPSKFWGTLEAIAIDSKNNIWVADGEGIEKYGPTGAFLAEIGEGGKGEGQLESATGLGIDANGNLWVADFDGEVKIFTSTGAYLGRVSEAGSAAGQLSMPAGIALDSAGDVWVADAKARVQKWIPDLKRPTVVTMKGSATEHGIVMSGTVNPNASETTIRFEYGESKAYDHVVPATAIKVGAGTKAIPAGLGASGLKAATEYHYRIIATNAVGTSWGKDEVLITPTPPAAVTEAPTAVLNWRATLHGKVNPHASGTTYWFEYGKTTSYGSLSSSGSAGSGTSDVAVEQAISGLEQGATYHYRVKATNAAGTSYGNDLTFKAVTVPDTFITSYMPSFTNGLPPPVHFASSQPGVNFWCSLDQPVGIGEPCDNPYTIAEHVVAGKHTLRVTAVDPSGVYDPTPATWTFSMLPYPPAPPANKLISPDTGSQSASFYTLQAEWGAVAAGYEGVSGVTFQVKPEGMREFITIPAKYLFDSKGNHPTWPLPGGTVAGRTEPLYFDAKALRYLEPWSGEILPLNDWGGSVQFRAAFDGGPTASGASAPVATEWVPRNGAPADAAETIGPAKVDLLTGSFTISRTDVSIPVPGSEAKLEFTRVYGAHHGLGYMPSLGSNWLASSPAEQVALGETWSDLVERRVNATPPVYEKECWNEEGKAVACGAGCPPQSCEEWMVEEAQPELNWIEVRDNQGAALAFEVKNGQYIAPDYAKEYALTKEGGDFVLTEPQGVRTTFSPSGLADWYRPTNVSWQATAKSVRMVYESAPSGRMRLSKMIAPAPAGVTCSDQYAIGTPGCRTLTFHYGGPAGQYEEQRLESIAYYNATGQNPQVVAQYAYDEKGQLAAAWDPRISPPLKETYSYIYPYHSALSSLTPPGEEPWELRYYDEAITTAWHPLKSVSRASLIDGGPSMATTTIAYDVPISGENAPHNLSPQRVAEWGQTDYPVDATAIFPPTVVPDEHPTDYSLATVKYMDPDGNVVNAASPSPPGVEGDSIETTETDRKGNVIRQLRPQNRLLALAAGGGSAARSRELDTHSTYSADGTEMLESWGPLHPVRLDSGEEIEARLHTVVQYDEGVSLPPGGMPQPHLPTLETTGAAIPGRGVDADQRITQTRYNWNLKKPIETIVDPGGLAIRSVTKYDEATGMPIESRQPKDASGGGPGTTVTVYYTATGSGECAGNIVYAGLPCKVLPAAQPGTPGMPELLIKRFTGYNQLGEPTEVLESPGGGPANVRKTTVTYDAAGRQLTKKIEGGGVAIPRTETLYNPTSGKPITQRFACEANCDTITYGSSFRTSGPELDRYYSPADIAVDDDGDTWAVNSAFDVIQKYNDAGKVVDEVGYEGTRNGEFINPTSIVFTSKGNFWVGDETNRLQEFDGDGDFIRTIGAKGSGIPQFAGIAGIAEDAEGDIWVADSGTKRLEELSASGAYKRGFAIGFSPGRIAAGVDGGIWVADPSQSRVVEFAASGDVIRQFGSPGSGPGQFSQLGGLETDDQGHIWLVDRGNSRIQEFSQHGSYLAQFGAPGSGAGQFSFNLSVPADIATGNGRSLWVVDAANTRIVKLSHKVEDGSTTTTYDRLGRPVAYTDADGNRSTVAYDLLGRPITTRDAKGTQTYRYDEVSGVLLELQDSAAGAFTASYDASGKLIERGLPNGLTARTTFSPAGQPTTLSYTKSSFCGQTCTWFAESLDRSVYGDILTADRTLVNDSYTYDKAGRLTEARETPVGGSCTTRVYAYDLDSNRTSLQASSPGLGGACASSGGGKQDYSYDAADRLAGPAYDPFGRITNLPAQYAGGKALSTTYYSTDMVAVQTQNGVTNTFELDASMRQRVRVQSFGLEGTETFHYNGPSDSLAWTERGATWSRNISGIAGELVAIQDSSSGVTIRLTNLHGDIVAIADLSPTATKLKDTFRFDEFGNPASAAVERYGWLGGKSRRTELGSGVIQMGARSYVPQLGRFLSPDPIQGGSANAYDYANANPIMNFDLTGELPGARDCLPGYIGCQCVLWAHLKKGKQRGTFRVTTVRKCNRVGGITMSGYASGWYVRNPPSSDFNEVPFLPPVYPAVRPACRELTDKCQNYQKYEDTLHCVPGREYEWKIAWGFEFNLRGGGHEESLHVTVQNYCPT